MSRVYFVNVDGSKFGKKLPCRVPTDHGFIIEAKKALLTLGESIKGLEFFVPTTYWSHGEEFWISDDMPVEFECVDDLDDHWYDDIPAGVDCGDPHNGWCDGDCQHCGQNFGEEEYDGFIEEDLQDLEDMCNDEDPSYNRVTVQEYVM